jgi:hypothetical protein
LFSCFFTAEYGNNGLWFEIVTFVKTPLLQELVFDQGHFSFIISAVTGGRTHFLPAFGLAT